VERGVLTLGITTSTSVMGVALAADGRLLAERVEPTDRRHAERLIPLVQEVLGSAGRRLDQVERLAADTGPGLFTGLRVGLATVGGLARALDVATVTASSLFLLAAGAGRQGDVLAVIDARRGEVFCQRFFVDGRRPVPVGRAVLIDPAAGLAAVAPSPVPALGDGATRYRHHFEAAGCQVVAADPSPAELVLRADELPVSPTRFPAACYLREPDARIGSWATRAS
jgi:tRNA threonylcarbamoyladenosine biosynthesis protein TsaB